MQVLILAIQVLILATQVLILAMQVFTLAIPVHIFAISVLILHMYVLTFVCGCTLIAIVAPFRYSWGLTVSQEFFWDFVGIS